MARRFAPCSPVAAAAACPSRAPRGLVDWLVLSLRAGHRCHVGHLLILVTTGEDRSLGRRESSPGSEAGDPSPSSAPRALPPLRAGASACVFSRTRRTDGGASSQRAASPSLLCWPIAGRRSVTPSSGPGESLESTRGHREPSPRGRRSPRVLLILPDASSRYFCASGTSGKLLLSVRS